MRKQLLITTHRLFRICLLLWIAGLVPGAAETCFAGEGGPGGMALVGENTIRDSAGREIRVNEPFSRIVSLYSAHTENLYTLGAADQVVGVSRIDAAMDGDIGRWAKQKKTLSARNSPERFLAASPDLVIVRPMLDHGYPRLMNQLGRFGVQVISLQPGDIDEMKTYWRILGRLTGREPAAEAMVERFEAGVSKAKAISGAIPERKTVYFEAIHRRFKTFSPGSMPLFALDCAGGINIAHDARPSRGTNIADFGMERIIARGEEIDVYLSQTGHMNRATIEEIRSVPGFTTIRAVRKGEIYRVDEGIVARPTIRLLEGIARIGAILYPDHFTEEARKKIMRHGQANEEDPDNQGKSR